MVSKAILFILPLALGTVFITPVLAQEGGEHSLNVAVQDSAEHEHSEEAGESQQVLPDDQAIPGDSESVFDSFSSFPNLHPMIVHFPVVLLLLAFVTQLIALFGWRMELGWITWFLLLGGFIGAILATQVFHVHVGDVPEPVHEIFETHEYYGMTTLWLSGAAFIFKSISQFLLKRKLWAEIIVFLVITASAVTVSLAGHLGSQMVYNENVGPQGKHLEEHDNGD